MHLAHQTNRRGGRVYTRGFRRVRDLKEAVRESGENIDVWTCEEAGQYQDDSWFCPGSARSRTRSAEAWNRREGILKLLPFFAYKLIAS